MPQSANGSCISGAAAVRRLSFRSIAAHKVRLLLTVLAVILGTAFIAGSLMFTAGLSRTFDSLVDGEMKNVDAVVSASPSPHGGASEGGGSQAPGGQSPNSGDVPETVGGGKLLARVRRPRGHLLRRRNNLKHPPTAGSPRTISVVSKRCPV